MPRPPASPVQARIKRRRIHEPPASTTVVYTPPDTGIHRLPFEILAHIFLKTIEDAESHRRDCSVARIVSHVSRFWRTVALETAELWRFIDFSEDAPFLRSRAHLARSKGYPLHIYLDLASRDGPGEPDEATQTATAQHLRAIISTLQPHAHRCSAIAFRTAFDDDIHDIFAMFLTLNRFPPLHTLSIMHTHGGFSDFLSDEHIAAGKAEMLAEPLRRLRHVHLEGTALAADSSVLVDLLTLEWGTQDDKLLPIARDFKAILKSSPQLQKLSLVNSGARLTTIGEYKLSSAITKASDNLIVLPDLDSLHLATHETQINYLLSIVSVPNLRELHLDTTNRKSTDKKITGPEMDALALFFTRDGPTKNRSLTRCTLTDVGAEVSIISRFFTSVPYLRSLVIKNCDTPNRALVSLTHILPVTRADARCPDMQYLEFQKCEGLDVGTLKLLVQSRQKLRKAGSACTISSIIVRDCSLKGGKELEVRDWLQKNVDLLVWENTTTLEVAKKDNKRKY